MDISSSKVTGSNLFGQWGNKIMNFIRFESPNFENTKLHRKLKLVKICWSYNILQINGSFFVLGSWKGEEGQLIEIKPPNEIKFNDCENILVSGNDFNLLFINTSSNVMWLMYLNNENTLKKINFNIESELKETTTLEAKSSNDQIIKVQCTNNLCLSLSSNGVVYTGFLPSYLDTSNCLGKVCDILCGYEHFMLLTDVGMVYTWGNGRRLQLGHDDLSCVESPKLVEALAGINIKKIAAGGWHCLALSEFGDLYVWGWNDTGQLGIKNNKPNENTVNPGVPTLVELYSDDGVEIHLNVIDIACGSRHSAILLEDNTVWTTGYNKYGQLGFSPEIYQNLNYFKKSYVDNSELKLICGPWCTLVAKHS